MKRLLAGDIGGTKTILRLDQVQANEQKTLYESTYASARYPNLNVIIEEFLAAVDGERPQRACLAIAGPVINNTSRTTNLPWNLDGHLMQQVLQIPHIHLINDFVAVGYGILALQPEDVIVLQNTPTISHQPIAVLGAGTGLGEAILVWQGSQYEVLSLEGGHTDFPARTALEIGLLQYLQKQYGRVSVERVVSGPGIYAIYQYLRETGFVAESPEVRLEMQTRDPSTVISNYGTTGTDKLCGQTLDMFVAAYGAEAGNLALKSLPYGGVYIAGGIGSKILTKMQDGSFIQNFLNKGRMRSLLEAMRVSLILNLKVGLIGAALFAKRLDQD